MADPIEPAVLECLEAAFLKRFPRPPKTIYVKESVGWFVHTFNDFLQRARISVPRRHWIRDTAREFLTQTKGYVLKDIGRPYPCWAYVKETSE